MKWVSKGKKKKSSFHRFFKSFGYAISGIITTCKTEQNFLIGVVCGIITVILGIVLKISMIELSIVIFVIGIVLALELINTSIEYTVDMAMPEIHPLAKQAKDIAAGAVLVSTIAAFIIGLIIFLPKIIN